MKAILADERAVAECGLAYKYEPAANPSAPLALLVHGRAGNFDVMWTFRRCLPPECWVFSVQAPHRDEIGGYCWWNLVKEARHDYNAMQAALASLDRFLERAMEYHHITPRKKAALGFSQGAGLLSMLLQRSPDRFSAVGLLAGFVIPLEIKAAALNERAAKVFISHGIEDKVIPIQKATEGALFLEQRGFSVTSVYDKAGHKVGSSGMKSLKTWLEECLN